MYFFVIHNIEKFTVSQIQQIKQMTLVTMMHNGSNFFIAYNWKSFINQNIDNLTLLPFLIFWKPPF